MAARYRDRSTGRFVPESTWKRSHARGGTRYVREHVRRKEEEEEEIERPRKITRLEEWYDEYDAGEEFESEEYEGGIDTGRRR